MATRSLLKLRRATRDRRIRRSVLALEAVMGVSGFGGGLWMVTHARSIMPLDYLATTPFPDWAWPGIFLFVFVGIGALLTASLEIIRFEWTPYFHMALGVGMMAWIALEADWIVWAPAMQVPYFLLGIAILAGGLWLYWEDQ